MRAVKPEVPEGEASITILCKPLAVNWKLNEKGNWVIKSRLMQSFFNGGVNQFPSQCCI